MKICMIGSLLHGYTAELVTPQKHSRTTELPFDAVSTAKSARAATFLPSATFLQPFYHLQHFCNIPCNMLLYAAFPATTCLIAATHDYLQHCLQHYLQHSICLQHVVRARWAGGSGGRGTPTHGRLEHAFSCPISDLFMLNFCGVFVAPCFPHHACAFCSVLLHLKSFKKNCLRKNIWMCCVLLLSVSTVS